MNCFAIVDVRAYAFSVAGSGGDDHDRERRHRLHKGGVPMNRPYVGT